MNTFKYIIGIAFLSLCSPSMFAQTFPSAPTQPSPFRESGERVFSLQQCIDYAQEHSLSIQRQLDKVKQHEISLNTSKNQRLPNLSGSASENFSFGRALTIDNTYSNKNTQNTSFSLSTDMPLYTGGQIENDIKIKKLDLQAALVDLDKAREDIALNVITAYLEAVYQKDLVTVSERQVELSKAQVLRMQKLFENGKASEAELAQIKATQANDELSLTQQQNTYSLALLSLSQLLELETPEGFDVEQPKVVDVSNAVLTSPDIIYSEALGIKPQVKAEQIRIQSAEKNIRLVQSGYYPTLHLGGGLGTSYYKTNGYNAANFGRQMKDNFNQYIGLSLSVPIFNRFSTRNSVRSARVQLHSQQLQLEETKKALYKEIQQAYYNAVAAQKQCISSDVALQSSRTSFDLMSKKYENGKANATEYQEQKTALLKAEASAIQAKYTFLFREKILNFYRGK